MLSSLYDQQSTLSSTPKFMFIMEKLCKFMFIMEKLCKFMFIMEKSCKFCLVLLFVLLSQIQPSLEITKTNIKTDEAALLALKSSIVLDPFQILAKNWSSGSSVCSWVGITCGSRHHRVVKLDIANMGLTGEIPTQISNLTFLGSLIMRNNGFYGDLPESLASLQRLRVLDLNSNSFSGTIPSWLGRLPKLKNLSLAYNDFSEFIPPIIFNISTLEEIDLSSNNISGNLPGNICHHRPSLRGIYLSHNQIIGELSSSLSNCSKLQVLSLSYNDFYGSIPKEIGDLKRLQKLHIAWNKLTGVIPSSLGNHPSLINLNVQNNQLNGHIPSTIFNMSSLEDLRLSNNTLSGSLPSNICRHLPSLSTLLLSHNYLEGHIPTDLHECKSITYLYLADNRHSGSIPKGIGNMTTLRGLILSDNMLTGEIPEELGNLHQLEVINVANNSLYGPIPTGIFNISSLYTILLYMNQLSGRLPSNFGSMLPNLGHFSLHLNLIGGSIPTSISNSSKLKEIALDDNNFRGPIPSSLGDLRSLEILYLSENYFTKESSSSELEFIYSLSNCIHLTDLNLGGNPLNATLPHSIRNLSTSLTRLSIYGAKLHGNITMEIGNLSNLVELSLDQNDFTGYIPTTIGGLQNLQRLYLGENKLEGPFPNDLCELNNLGILSMERNSIFSPIPSCIGNISSLREINLGENRLSGNIPESLWNLKDVLSLNLSHNSITGSLSSGVSSMRAITTLDLSNNLFSGNFPKGVGDLLTLDYLDLSHNGVNGFIPDIFDKLWSLEYLDLSSNNFSGALPQSIEKLKLLKFFNVSSNQLGGQIPEGGMFHNFTYESFNSNKGFCGAPWLHFPPCPRINKSDKKRSVMYAFISITTVVVFVAIFILVLRKFRSQRSRNQGDPLEEDIARISYLQLRRATSGFSEACLIGIGGFGSVYKAILTNGDVYAVKVFHSQHEDAFKSFDRECDVLRNIRHRNIVKVVSSCSNLDFKSLILQYMPNGSLESWLYSNELFLDFQQRLDIMIDVGCAFEYLHHGYTTPVVHCDLKPSNVLIDFDMVGHVTDFGISRLLGDEEHFLHTMTLATFGYMAPEYGTDGLVSTKCDVYSFGILLFEVFTRKKPNDEMFNEGSNLRSWVSDAASYNLYEVIDRAILQPDEEIFDKKLRAVYSIIELGLNCSVESQERRTNMVEALATLRKIKRDLI